MKKKDLSQAPLEVILNECALLRGVQTIQHRIIHEFDWFVQQCVFGELREKYKPNFSTFINEPYESAIKKWGLLFYDFYYEEHKDD